jgi:hypothetical protein
MVAQKNMVSLAKLLRIRQEIGKKYKSIGLKIRLSIKLLHRNVQNMNVSRGKSCLLHHLILHQNSNKCNQFFLH